MNQDQHNITNNVINPFENSFYFTDTTNLIEQLIFKFKSHTHNLFYKCIGFDISKACIFKFNVCGQSTKFNYAILKTKVYIKHLEINSQVLSKLAGKSSSQPPHHPRSDKKHNCILKNLLQYKIEFLSK